MENIDGFYQLINWTIAALLIPVLIALFYHLNHFVHAII